MPYTAVPIDPTADPPGWGPSQEEACEEARAMGATEDLAQFRVTLRESVWSVSCSMAIAQLDGAAQIVELIDNSVLNLLDMGKPNAASTLRQTSVTLHRYLQEMCEDWVPQGIRVTQEGGAK